MGINYQPLLLGPIAHMMMNTQHSNKVLFGMALYSFLEALLARNISIDTYKQNLAEIKEMH